MPKEPTLIDEAMCYVQKNPFIQAYPWVSKVCVSAFGGLVNTTLFHTPPTAVMNEIMNRALNQAKVDYKVTPWDQIRYFNGLLSMNAATMVMVSGSITTNQYVTNQLTSRGYAQDARDKYAISIFSGMLAGFPASVLEGIGQAQQRQSKINPPKIRQIASCIYKNHGLLGFTRGMAATATRSAGFTSGYLGLMPLVIAELKNCFGDTPFIYVLTGVMCGVIIAPVTAPFNILQMTRKNRFDLNEPSPRYRETMFKWYQDAKKTSAPWRNLALNAVGGPGALIVRIGATSAQFAFLFWFSQAVNQMTPNGSVEQEDEMRSFKM